MNHHNREMRSGVANFVRPVKIRGYQGKVRPEAYRIFKKITAENKATSGIVDTWADINKKKERVAMIAAAHKKLALQ